MKNKKFNFGEWFMNWGFFGFIAIIVLIFLAILFFTPQEQKDKLEKSPCFFNSDCRNCIGKSYCEEVGLEYQDIVPNYNKIICFKSFSNITSMDYTFRILDREKLLNRYNCEVKK